MKERPMLFAAPMVRAVLEGRKTQTRRIAMLSCCGGHRMPVGKWTEREPGSQETTREKERAWVERVAIQLGSPGERIWVRETWGVSAPEDHWDERQALADAKSQMPWAAIVYRADPWDTDKAKRWRPSIHMPRWASRITLEIVSVRAERLQDITEEDARAEGVEWHGSAQAAFWNLWDKINGERAPWSSNPWVWRIEFKRLP